MSVFRLPRFAQSGLCTAAFLFTSGAVAPNDIAPTTEAPYAGDELPEASRRMQAIAGGAGEDGSACLLQREGRAVARGPVIPNASGVLHLSNNSSTVAQKVQDQQLLQVQRAEVAIKEAYEARPQSRSVSLTSGMSDGMGIEQSPLPAAEALLSQEAAAGSGKAGVPAPKDKAILMAIEMFPPAWLLGLDRFYLGSFRTGVAKVLVSIVTLSVGGFVWGLVDFFVIVANALKRQEALHALGMEADFKPGMLQGAFYMAIADLILLPLWVGLARYIWWVRKMQRMERLKENAMKSPHFKASGTAIRGG
uniref:TM2 domain-containing protein n=1 Tax=Alexandrium catenella TaxID=2925 RepID=A0A7S1Q4N0_ALECA|mmetsp:Transcript_17035/g.46138  ORF Transcript_17035/g.46138 Transcript_17035/m.46138 type:complete len:307 (+) Transcript_17035:75-995(+)